MLTTQQDAYIQLTQEREKERREAIRRTQNSSQSFDSEKNSSIQMSSTGAIPKAKATVNSSARPEDSNHRIRSRNAQPLSDEGGNTVRMTSTSVYPGANSTTVAENLASAMETQLKLLEQKHALEKKQLEERFICIRQYHETTGPDEREISNPVLSELRTGEQHFHEISNSQVAARQAVARDLPVFAGHPEDWPLFYASFNSSTRMCGFSDEENMLRLQRSLKGKALEAVKCRLLHPTNLNGVISTLRTLFGRPEAIDHSLVNRIRKMPTPRAEKLNTLIDFGVAVQNV